MEGVKITLCMVRGIRDAVEGTRVSRISFYVILPIQPQGYLLGGVYGQTHMMEKNALFTLCFYLHIFFIPNDWKYISVFPFTKNSTVEIAQLWQHNRGDLSGLIHVTHIESDFLWGCRSLRTLDLTPLSSVTQIGARFLDGCRSLCTLD